MRLIAIHPPVIGSFCTLRVSDRLQHICDSVMEQAAEKVCSSMGEGAVVLVKGSRGMGLERAVAHILGENSHD